MSFRRPTGCWSPADRLAVGSTDPRAPVRGRPGRRGGNLVARHGHQGDGHAALVQRPVHLGAHGRIGHTEEKDDLGTARAVHVALFHGVPDRLPRQLFSEDTDDARHLGDVVVYNLILETVLREEMSRNKTTPGFFKP